MTKNTKQQVREFYDQIGWSQEEDGNYQNATYEDLRPVAKEYTHRTHLRVSSHLTKNGKYLLDAGSGPVQYPEYLTYSEGYDYRVCVDISSTALREARQRLGEHGLYVIADIAKLPFKEDAFDGIVSLHSIHHLHVDEHPIAYRELYRVLVSGHTAVVVNGWGRSPFFRVIHTPWRVRGKLRRLWRNFRSHKKNLKSSSPEMTFVDKYNADWLKEHIGSIIPLKIYVWRSVTSVTTRLYAHSWLGGKGLLRLLFKIEENHPRWLGEHGAYPLVVISKDNQKDEKGLQE